LSDDGVRLWVNGQLLINNWNSHPATENSNTIVLVAGQTYDLTMEFFNSTSQGTAVLMWTPPGQLKQVVPVSNLTPHRNNNPPLLAPLRNIAAIKNSLLTFAAIASDPDAPFQSLAFALDPGAPAGASINASSGIFAWTPASVQSFGNYDVTIRVTDNGTPAMTDAQTFRITVISNAAATAVTLVPPGATWRFLDNGTDQGSAWREDLGESGAPTWKSGAAPLGYGYGDEATIVSYGSNPTNKYVTTYFVRPMFLPDASLVQSLSAHLWRDDGAVLYINGVEAWRDNMPASAITYSMPALAPVASSTNTNFISKTISPALLVSGTNIVAVEIHRAAADNADMRFDLSLSAAALVPTDTALDLVSSVGGTALRWPFEAGLFQLYSATNLSPPAFWMRVPDSPVFTNGYWVVPVPIRSNQARFYRLQTQ
jgi:hypothetical protein